MVGFRKAAYMVGKSAYMVGGWVAGLTENKTKSSSWSLAELGNILSLNIVYCKSCVLCLRYLREINMLQHSVTNSDTNVEK